MGWGKIELVTLSDYLGLDNKLDEEGIFDTILDIDANYFINIKRIKDISINIILQYLF